MSSSYQKFNSSLKTILNPCPSCTGGYLIEQGGTLTEAISWWKCNQCGLRKRRKDPSQELPARPLTSESLPIKKSSKLRRATKGYPVPRRVSVPNLKPPLIPGSAEDWNGTYQIQCGTYAGYQHFRERAAIYRATSLRSRILSNKMSTDYRARLCENLASTLGKIYMRQPHRLLRDRLRKERKLGHPLEERSVTLKRLDKQYARLMLQAMDHLSKDPLVLIWATNRKTLGDWDYLRSAGKSFSTGVKKPYPSGQDALVDQTIFELGVEGMAPAKIRAELKAKGLPTFTRQWISQRLKHYTIPVVIGKTRKVFSVTGKYPLILRRR